MALIKVCNSPRKVNISETKYVCIATSRLVPSFKLEFFLQNVFFFCYIVIEEPLA